MKQLKLKVNREEHIKHTITIFSGYYSLSDLEQKMLLSIIKHYLTLKEQIKSKELFDDNFLNTKFRKELMEEFGWKPPQLTAYLNRLKEKKVLKEEGSIYSVDSKFIPQSKLQFEFIYIEETSNGG
jgi:hypothetical protein